jgi:hypothetical protein
MSCFVGKIDAPESIITAFRKQNIPINPLPIYSLSLVETTDLFNCDSVGCIAGFATGLANDWKTPEFMKQEDEEYLNWQFFEEEANKFLGLTSVEGNNLYYSKGYSVWKMVKWFEPERYPKLEWDESDSSVEWFKQNKQPWSYNDIEIELQSIDYKSAADVLTRIMNEEIILADKEGKGIPQFVEKEIV